MAQFDPQTASIVAGLCAAQRCRQRPDDPYPSDVDDDTECLEWPGHELCEIDHRSANGTTW
jgi:hypothetical protein